MPKNPLQKIKWQKKKKKLQRCEEAGSQQKFNTFKLFLQDCVHTDTQRHALISNICLLNHRVQPAQQLFFLHQTTSGCRFPESCTQPTLLPRVCPCAITAASTCSAWGPALLARSSNTIHAWSNEGTGWQKLRK